MKIKLSENFHLEPDDFEEKNQKVLSLAEIREYIENEKAAINILEGRGTQSSDSIRAKKVMLERMESYFLPDD